MGAENRGELFSHFIVKNYPKAKRVLVIADGKGQVARKLANKGISCHIIDPQKRWEGKLHPLVTYEKDYFYFDKNIEKFDMIVGMHPDEATSEIVLYARKLEIPTAIVPCCIKGRHTAGVQGFQQWLNKLTKIYHGEIRFAKLKMSGMNTVLYTPTRPNIYK
jgi:hypothetical protein